MKFLSKVSFIFSVSIIIYLLTRLFTASTTNESLNFYDKGEPTCSFRAVKLPAKLDFAGEAMPIENFDIYESLDKEIHKCVFWQSETFLYFKRANRLFPIIEPILRKNNVPDDFKFLAVAESGLENVVSPSGARGVWQFMKNTAKEHKLEVTEQIDERYNLEKSTEAACEYLNSAYKKYKSWTLVAASYNMGRAALNRDIKKQKSQVYYDMLLNTETSRYVFRIVAYKLILQDPHKYGFIFDGDDLYSQLPFYELTVDSQIIDWIDFAQKNATNYKILHLYNPWIRSDKLNNTSKKKYTVKLPKINFRKVIHSDSTTIDTTE